MRNGLNAYILQQTAKLLIAGKTLYTANLPKTICEPLVPENKPVLHVAQSHPLRRTPFCQF